MTRRHTSTRTQARSALLLLAALVTNAPAGARAQTAARDAAQSQTSPSRAASRTAQNNQPIAVLAETVYTMAGQPITRGVVLVRDGKIERVGRQGELRVPGGYRTINARVVTPGLVDAHSTVGLSGLLNQVHDQDQLERSAAMQPELRALDAYNPQDALVTWLRQHGITTVHTGHGPGALVSGGTMIVKTVGNTVDEALVRPDAMIAVTLGPGAYAQGGRAPGTRAKEIALLRQELLRAQETVRKGARAGGATTNSQGTTTAQGATAGSPDPATVPPQPGEQLGARGTTDTTAPAGRPADAATGTGGQTGGGGGTGGQAGGQSSTQSGASGAGTEARDLRREAMVRVVRGETPLLITAHRAQDIVSALRLAREFNVKIVLDGAAEAYLVADEIKRANVPVIVHATMYRAAEETENLTLENAAILRRAGIPVALQSGYEAYVPKTRVVLFEAAMLAANGLTQAEALATVTIDAARMIGVADRVGSLEAGKDADLALFDGDPLEYTSHVVGVIIDGQLVSEERR